MLELSIIQKIAIYTIPVIFAITVHEVAHGWVASKLGDQTARLSGRLTLNPIKHIDPVGTVILPLILLAVGNFIFGWAKPVPVDSRNLRNPKRDMAWVAIAGPAANLVMLVFWLLLAKCAVSFQQVFQGFVEPMIYMAMAGVMINLVLILLNLIPLPPLDGSRIVSAFLPAHLSIKYDQIERYGFIILLLLFATGILGKILGPPLAFFYNLFLAFL